MPQTSERVHEFGPFRYDAGQRLLFRDGEIIPLVPKAIDTLQVLLERRGRVVGRDELMRLVWPDTVVEETGLARNIYLLRKALGAEADLYIETIPKRGYRFLAGPPGAKASSRSWLWLVATGLAVLAAFVYWQFYAASRYLPQGNGFAVLAALPFDCLPASPECRAFSQGFNEVLVTELSKLERVHVISPSTVRRYQQFRISPAVMARLLGVEVILEGSVQQEGDRRVITTRLADVHSGKLIWGGAYDSQVPAPASAITEQIGTQLRASR